MTTRNDERRPQCRAKVYDKFSEESRPCMRRAGDVAHASLNNIYCWQHALMVTRIYGGRTRNQGARR